VNYDDSIRFLYDLRLFGFKLGLDNTRRLAALAGNPQDRLRFIHVAGTNGKGSTCAMLESIYRAAGLRVGLFTSPHLISFRERIQVNRQLIAEAEVVRWVERIRSWLGAFPPDHSPTFFEVVTVMALGHFAQTGCELVIWETGLGGRLDATNIVTPLASIITNIQFDHEQWLGNTLAKIAAEKAGIIKPGVPVFTAADAPEALAVIRTAAALVGAPLTEITPAAIEHPPLDTLSLPLPGEHQRLNAALALATVRSLDSLLSVDEATLRQGLAAVHWDGRFQILRPAPDRITLLDGAHNPAGVQALEAALARHFPNRHPAVILGVMRDKDWPAMCRRLSPLARAVYLVPVASPRSAASEDLRPACQTTAPGVPVVVCDSLAEALTRTDHVPFRVVTGSLYLIGEALDLLDPPNDNTRHERALNDWLDTGLRHPKAPPAGGGPRQTR
jgi:dihydrofolate synthase/folylpolyglutamate synthase